MANPGSPAAAAASVHPPSLPAVPPLSSKKENQTPVTSKIEVMSNKYELFLKQELNESRAELLNRIQGLKQDLQSWRSKLDTQVNVYRDELSELKKSLNVEVDQLRTEFQELRTTLQQQQEDVNASLKNLGLQDAPENPKIEVNEEAGQAATTEDNHKESE